MHNDVEPKPMFALTVRGREKQISARLQRMLEQHTLQKIAASTDYKSETVRRYLIGESRVPADFVAIASMRYDLDVHQILYGDQVLNHSIRTLPTELLTNELGRRMALIENCVVASSIVNG